MWHLGLRKEKDIIALVLVFVVLGVLITIIVNQCGVLSCSAPALEDPGIINSFDGR
jgi:hypothetical protein